MSIKLSSSRLEGIPESIFSTMSRLALEHNAVNLGQGFPDFDGPEWIMEEAFRAMKSGKNQYAPSIGILSLRQAIAKIHNEYYGIKWDYNTEITVTAGATEALFSSILALVEPGDEVILFEPFYDAYQANVLIAGGIPVYVTLHKPDFRFDYGELEKAITSRTKMIILNSPHNPTGKVFSMDELKEISRLAIKNDLLVLSDEVYEFLTYDEARHIPVETLPGMKERTVTISSTGKTFGMTGWKIGYAVASEKITEAIRGIHQWATFAVNTPGQHAMAHAFSKLHEYMPEFRKLYLEKRDLMMKFLQESPFKPHKPYGSYFIMADFPRDIYQNDIECALTLVQNPGIATIPPSVFYGKSDEGRTMLRICFAKRTSTLESGIERFKKIFNL